MEEFNISKTIPEFKNEAIDNCIKNLSVSLFRENGLVDDIIYNICQLRRLIKGTSTCEITEESEVIVENMSIKIKYDFYDITTKIFGFKKRTIQKILQCEKFLENSSNGEGIVCSLKKGFHGFSLSKLFELLPLGDKAIDYVMEGYITCEYTVQEVRLKVQELLGKEVIVKNKNVNDFDLNEEYTLNDFKTRWTKTGLIDIAFSLYNYCHGYMLGKKK